MYGPRNIVLSVECRVSAPWIDVPTPEGPDMQVRWAGHTGTPDASGPAQVQLEVRVKPEEGNEPHR